MNLRIWIIVTYSAILGICIMTVVVQGTRLHSQNHPLIPSHWKTSKFESLLGVIEAYMKSRSIWKHVALPMVYLVPLIVGHCFQEYYIFFRFLIVINKHTSENTFLVCNFPFM